MIAGPMRADGERTLSEHASKALLAGYGVPVAREALVADAEAAACTAAEIGFPVVVKLCGDTVAHKTERSLVRPAVSRTRQRLLRSRIVCFDAPARGGLRRGWVRAEEPARDDGGTVCPHHPVSLACRSGLDVDVALRDVRGREGREALARRRRRECSGEDNEGIDDPG